MASVTQDPTPEENTPPEEVSTPLEAPEALEVPAAAPEPDAPTLAWDQLAVHIGNGYYRVRIGLPPSVQRKAKVILSIVCPQGLPCAVMNQALVVRVNTTFFENPDLEATEPYAYATALLADGSKTDVEIQLKAQ